MNLEQLKNQIESNKITNTFIIFECEEHTFIADQYIKEISKCLNRPIEYIDSLDMFMTNELDIFGESFDTTSNTIRVYRENKFTLSSDKISENQNLIIITGKLEKDIKKLFEEYVVTVPKLQSWQIKDYAYSLLEGIQPEYLDWLILNCNEDIHRLQLEIDKLLLFTPPERKILFKQMIDDDAFGDITHQTIFDFTDGIVKKDINKLIKVYEDIDNIDIEPIGVVTLLIQNFKKLIQVWMQKNPTPENTGLSSKQIWAINKLPRVWTASQLIEILEFLTNIDFRIKTGQMPMEHLRDYLVMCILSR